MKLNPSVEMIDFQSKDKRDKYMQILSDLKKVGKKALPDHELVDELSKVTMEFFGLKINFIFTPSYFGPCIMLPSDTKNNPLVFPEWVEMGQNSIQSTLIEAKKVIGTIDVKRAKVGGHFSTLLFTIYYPIELFKGELLTIEEHTGVLMHEIGHAFTMTLASSRTIATNMILQYANKAIKGTQSVEEREVVYLNIKNKMGIKSIDEKELAKTNNKFSRDVVLVSNIAKDYRNELGSNIYSMTSCEQQADQFAARMGCGVHVVTGLAKIYKKYFHISTRSTALYFFVEFMKIMLLFMGIFAVIGRIMIAIDSTEEPTYDRPEVRFKRIREDLIQQAKTPDLPMEVAKEIKAGIMNIDEILEGVHDRYQLCDVIANYIIPSRRAMVSQKDFQRQLEELSSNDLYFSALRLQTLGE